MTTCRPRRFLGIAGAIAINGYDGFLYSIGFLVAWLVALLLVAELLRNTGRFTMADVLSFRLRQRPVRMAAAISTLVVSLLLPAGPDGRRGRPGGPAAGHRRPSRRQGVVIAVVGAIMIIYVLVGGMKGTTWVQIVKAVLLIVGAAVMTVLGAGPVRLQPLRRDRRGGRATAGRGRDAARARPAVRQEHRRPRSTSSRSAWPSCSAPPACRTC